MGLGVLLLGNRFLNPPPEASRPRSNMRGALPSLNFSSKRMSAATRLKQSAKTLTASNLLMLPVICCKPWRASQTALGGVTVPQQLPHGWGGWSQAK
jgi:hypothetical protein